MRPILSFLIAALCPIIVQASGKISAEPHWYPKSNDLKLAVGLTVYEHFKEDAALNAFIGSGESPLLDGSDLNWFVAKAMIDLKIKDIILSPGAEEMYFWQTGEHRPSAFMRFSYKLW